MFIGHFAVGLAGRRLTPRTGLGWWFAAVVFLDAVWPVMLLLGLEQVAITPSPDPFLNLTFISYPISHSLVAAVAWAIVFAGAWRMIKGRSDGALLLAAGVLSHWVLDVISHVPDMPVLPHGPYIGLGLWRSVRLTVVVEVAMFAAGIAWYARGRHPRMSFWLLMGLLFVLYIANLVSPAPPSVAAIAWTSIVAWLFIPWAWWADRPRVATEAERTAPGTGARARQ